MVETDWYKDVVTTTSVRNQICFLRLNAVAFAMVIEYKRLHLLPFIICTLLVLHFPFSFGISHTSIFCSFLIGWVQCFFPVAFLAGML